MPPPPAPTRLSVHLPWWRALAVIAYTPFALLVFVFFWLACLFDRLLPLPPPFPRHPAALARRRRWLEKVLSTAGALPPGAVVTAFSVEPFKRGEVFRSTLATVQLAYTHEGRAEALALVAKFSASFGTISQQVISILQRNALNEIQLYRAHHQHAGATPRAFYARAAGLAGRFLILLERLEPAYQIEEEDGAPIETAREVVTLYARLHATHWRHDPSSRRPGVPVKVPGLAIDFACSLAWGRRRKLSRQLARASWHHGNRAQTIVHGDARIKNLIFRARSPEGHPIEPVLIDWQATRWGLGAYDLAYFVLLSLTPETRMTHERELVERYHAALVESGVADFDLDALWEDYRHSVLLVFSLLFLPLLGGEQTLDDDNRARATSVAMAWHERVLAALATFDPEFVRSRYGLDPVAFAHAAAWIATHPHPLNSGARLVAAELARREDPQRRRDERP